VVGTADLIDTLPQLQANAAFGISRFGIDCKGRYLVSIRWADSPANGRA